MILALLLMLSGDGVVRLAPREFPELPEAVRRDLEKRGCTVPQAYLDKRVNVIRGEFGWKGQTDWALLCSRWGASRILVYWNGDPLSVHELDWAPDRFYLQDVGGGRWAYSRVISPVGEDFILSHYRAYGGPKPPPITHQGIDVAFLEKASVVRYFHKSRWLTLTGAD